MCGTRVSGQAFRFYFAGLPLNYLAARTAQDRVRNLATSIDEQLLKDRRGEIIRQGIQLAIIGAPNAGKSSLLNWLGRLARARLSILTTDDMCDFDCSSARGGNRYFAARHDSRRRIA